MTLLPPVWSGSTFVLMTKRIGCGGAGELINALIAGLDQPTGLAYSPHRNPTQGVTGVGVEISLSANCLTVVSSLFAIAAVPVSTSRIPSLPTDIVTFAPSPTSM